ncbi:tail fiber protein [Salmonella enterica]|nr:tail fiber protein [Salmonella enterica]EKD1324941.1 tail fiber protein [Salmonella enterica]MBJ3597396.1 tail fiber protein [Salmonella enterica subsp. enterica serovar Reading]MBJ5849789.1 tail fiber protein [Salmonella enterica subsp. enterica serovar Reading]
MGADKTNNIMTLSSGVSQPLLADVQYFELYSSLALNRKLKNIVLPGFYCGFEPVPGTGLSVRITSENSEGKGAASVDVNNVQISVQQIEDVTVSVKAGATNIIVLEANFEHGVKTTQVDSASSVSAARIYARTDNTIGQNQIELCRVIVPGGATAVTKEMIVLKYRVNRAVGVEFSNEISSTEERKAATPLAVKTLHDLVDTKAPLDSPHLSGTPTSPTPEPGTNNAQIANTAFVKAAITTLINGAPSTLDTLKEIAAAINNDPNFSTTINNALALKAPLASPALTGIPTAPTAAQGTNNTQIATTAYVRAAISALVGSSPEALDTLNELAAALGNDPNFATTMTNALAGKQPLDATLTALAGLPTGANKLPYFTGTDTVAQTDLTQVGRDILAKSNTQAIIQYLGLGETINLAAGAVQKTGDEMNGKLTLPQTSSFGVNTNNTLGGSSIAIGDNDTGLKGNGDGNLAFMANNVLAGYFNENELQHSKKMLTKNFQALVDNNWPEGAGGFSGQLSSEAPFSVPMVHRQNNDNNFFPLLKGKVSLESGYPVAASFGILTSGNTNFPQIAIHAKTDFDVNDKIWVFDVATGEFRAPGRITATEILLSGKSRVAPDGNLYGDVWGGWLNDFLNNNYNRKNTASLGDYGWVRDESTGFIMQWGTLGSSNGTYNFPREFPASCFAVFVTNNNQQGGAVDNAFGYPVSKSQFFAATKDSSSSNHINNYPVAWFAIGR